MRSKVSELLEKINRLAGSPAFPQVSDLEFDLLLHHLRELYNELNSLKDSSLGIVHPAEVDNKNTDTEVTPPIVAEEKKISFTETKLTRKSEANIPQTGATPISKKTINEVILSSESLHTKLAGSPSKEVHQKLSSKPLKDLLDLNKRFVVINELFNGNKDAFSAAVHRIDSSVDYVSADLYIRAELMTAYAWNETSPAVALFLNLVKQKFGEV